MALPYIPGGQISTSRQQPTEGTSPDHVPEHVPVILPSWHTGPEGFCLQKTQALQKTQ